MDGVWFEWSVDWLLSGKRMIWVECGKNPCPLHLKLPRVFFVFLSRAILLKRSIKSKMAITIELFQKNGTEIYHVVFHLFIL